MCVEGWGWGVTEVIKKQRTRRGEKTNTKMIGGAKS